VDEGQSAVFLNENVFFGSFIPFPSKLEKTKSHALPNGDLLRNEASPKGQRGWNLKLDPATSTVQQYQIHNLPHIPESFALLLKIFFNHRLIKLVAQVLKSCYDAYVASGLPGSLCFSPGQTFRPSYGESAEI
jgi:hypothetical protein